jgi:hypothetical protein
MFSRSMFWTSVNSTLYGRGIVLTMYWIADIRLRCPMPTGLGNIFDYFRFREEEEGVTERSETLLL